LLGKATKVYNTILGVPYIIHGSMYSELEKIKTNARLSGLILAMLIESNYKYNKSVSLISFGHGSLVLENCLK
jgi:TolB-like protein